MSHLAAIGGVLRRPALGRAFWLSSVLVFVSLSLATAEPTSAHGGYVVFYSDSPDRGAPRQLEGARVPGLIHAFVLPEDGIERAEFHIDDPLAVGPPVQTETAAPYDLGGGSVSTAQPFDTSALADGFHTLTAVVTTTDGHVQTIQTGFDVGVGDPKTTRADEIPGADLSSGRFELLGTATPGHTALAGTALMARSTDKTTVTVDMAGLLPNADYLFHVHAATCSDGAAPHYQHDVGGSPYPPNEIHLAFRADANGAGSVSVESDGVAGPEAQSIVMHPVGVMTRVACAQFAPALALVDDRAPIRINTGGPAQTVDGVDWQGCQNPDCGGLVSGGFSYVENDTITGMVSPANQTIYQSEWTGGQSGPGAVPVGATAFAFDIPVDNGDWNIRLHYAELNKFAAGTRVFDVDVENGQAIWSDFDVWAQGGGAADVALVRDATVTVTDGDVDIDFTRRVENAKISAIELIPVGTPPPPPPPMAEATGLFSWETKASSPIVRQEAQGAAVDNKLYVFGGFHQGLLTTARSDVYDPSTNTWRRIADMPEELTHSPVVVVDDVIWFFGGYVGDHPGGSTTHVWRYNTQSDTWDQGPDLPAARGGSGAALVGRTLHVFGGTNRAAGTRDDIDQPHHWALSLDGGDWVRRADLPNPRNHMSAVGLNGLAYAIGGQHNANEDTGNQAQVDAYNPSTDQWTRVADLPVARGHTTASAIVHQGRILLIGGTEPGNRASDDVTAYDPTTNVWVSLPSLPGARKTPVAGVIGGHVYVTTGSATSTTWRGDITERWERSTSMPVALGEVAGGILGDELILVGEGSAATLSFDLTSGTWASVNSLPARPYPGNHHAAQVIGGKLWLFGGLGGGAAGRVQVFDPATRKWSTRANMPFAAGSSSSAVINGKVYVAGGIVGSTTTRKMAVYDPANNRWKLRAPMPRGRNHAASGSDGTSLFVFGGRGPGSGPNNTVANGFADVQVYNPATNSWRSSTVASAGLSPLPQARGGTGTAAWLGGRFYVMGGETATGAGATPQNVYDRVDVYDPATNVWTRGADMPTPRHGIFPLVVAGRIVVAGGGVVSANSQSNVVEIYNP